MDEQRNLPQDMTGMLSSGTQPDDFHPLVREWFRTRYGQPTDIQQRSWPIIQSGKHVLISAPTGSGKTLTAFLSCLDRFIRGTSHSGATRVLYVSPLKALNNDIQRNLLAPLSELRALHTSLSVAQEDISREFPAVQVQTRSGDTPQNERQRMLRRPPEILITTPESLNLLLTTARGRQALAHIETVILDEIHALAENRRGVLLTTALERLEWISPQSVQRIALSATVNPMSEVAHYVGGYDSDGTPRAVTLLESADEKRQQFRVRFPVQARDAAQQGKKIWDPLSEEFRHLLEHNRSTLFFTNSRRLAEKITLKINQDQPEPLAYAHHGSLAREIRHEVENRLKQGQLKAIVATSSLEMGIDIGRLDEVVMIQSPPTIAATIQRMGRAGHAVGEISRGSLFPSHAQDFIEAAALALAVEESDIEPMRFLHSPLDVLAQIIVSMSASETWDKDAMLALLRQSHPYRDLTQQQFDLVIDMLGGRYSGSRVRDLKPRLSIDRLENTVRANKAAQFALYNAGGVIPDRGYYKLRHTQTGALIGELDEEFVWEAQLGQAFTLGTQHWQIQRITHNEVMVRPATSRTTPPPFWRSETFNRSDHFSTRIGDFLEFAEARLQTRQGDVLVEELCTRRGFEESAAQELLDYLQQQREHTGAALPHRHHLVLEQINAGPGGYQSSNGEQQLVWHTHWGGQVNQPLALALDSAWRATFASDPQIHADNNTVVIQTKDSVDPEQVLSLVDSGNVIDLLRASLENSGFFGARFRECAGRALLVTRKSFNQRLPFWMSRLQAKKLMARVREYQDFPILLETWRSCLKDEFDLDALQRLLTELETGDISCTQVVSATPSPFAANISWNQINRYMYADDTPEQGTGSALTDELIRSTALSDALHLTFEPVVIAEFLAKRQRVKPGYTPRSREDLEDWVKERILIPQPEWLALQSACARDGLELAHPPQPPICHIDYQAHCWITHQELLPSLLSRFPGTTTLVEPQSKLEEARDLEQLVSEILSFYGPLTRMELCRYLPLSDGMLDPLLLSLTDSGQLLLGPWIQDDASLYYCDAQNFDILLRFQRANRRKDFPIHPATELPQFLARWNQIAQPFPMPTRTDSEPPDGPLTITLTEPEVGDVLERLSGYVAPVATWLEDLIAARFPTSYSSDQQLQQAIISEAFQWLGCGAGRICVFPREELSLIRPPPQEQSLSSEKANSQNPILQAFQDPQARYSFFQLVDNSTLDTESASNYLWQAVWQGEVTTDSLLPLQQGFARQFKLTDTATPSAHRETNAIASPNQPTVARQPAYPRPQRGRLKRRSRQLSQGWPGSWLRLAETRISSQEQTQTKAQVRESTDELDRLELHKDQARLLLDRYGLLCRELVQRESGAFQWRFLFKALRLMEFSGEVVAGLFFEQLSGPQFALPQALSYLRRSDSPGSSFWISALDPVAPCGLSLSWPEIELPVRRPGNHLCFSQGELVMTSYRSGQRLVFHLPTENPRAVESTLPLLRHLLHKQPNLLVQQINGADAQQSSYLENLREFFRVVREYKGVTLSA